jgi:hypothetical protein
MREIIPEVAEQVEPLFWQVIASGEPIQDKEIHGTTPAEPVVVRYWRVSYYPVKPSKFSRAMELNLGLLFQS